jgi:hypothetical protein
MYNKRASILTIKRGEFVEQEQTTTETGVQETNGVEQSAPTPSTESTQPEVEHKVEAESNVNEDSSPVESSDSSDSTSNEDLSKWAESKGLNLEDPESVQKLAKSYREAEKKLHETAQTKSELEKQLVPPGNDYQFMPDGSLDVYSEVQNVKTQLNLQNFYMENPDARQYDEKMAEIALDKPELGLYAKNSGDFSVLLALAKQGDERQQGGREALQKLADKQQAAVAGAAASVPVSNQPKVTRALMQERLAAGDTEWFDQNQDTINSLMAEGRLE